MQGHCGLVNPDAACHCRRRVNRAVELERVNPKNLLFADHPVRSQDEQIQERVAELDELQRSAAIQRSIPQYAAPVSLLDMIRSQFESGRFRVLKM